MTRPGGAADGTRQSDRSPKPDRSAAAGDSVLLTGIGQLVTADPQVGPGLAALTDAALAWQDGRITWVGPASAAPACDRSLDAGGAAVLPGFVDSHTHLVFGGDRAAEFTARMAGRAYAAGGIATTVAATRAASDAELAGRARQLAGEALRSGTTTLEAKSGYGLTTDDELRLLQVAAAVADTTTFLGAHVVPAGSARDDYLDLVCGPMLAACAGTADWIDVFCDRGAFAADEAERVLRAGAAAGLGLRLHAGQLGLGAGVALGVALGAASVDHCTHLTDADRDALGSSDTVATLLPAADFCTRSPYPDGRALLDAGATVALASDCNPGTSFTTSMPFAIALAVRECGLDPTEAVLAATRGGAKALRRDDVGVLRPGARADLLVLDAPQVSWLAYRPGVALAALVVRGGEVMHAGARTC